MLELSGIHVNYGAAPALWDVALKVDNGELVCVVGPNGAGKTTLINTVAGLLRARSGSMRYQGTDITRLAPHRFCDAGIALVPEGRRLFTGMSVHENLDLGSFRGAARARREQSLDAVLALFPRSSRSWQHPPGLCRAGSSRWWPSVGP